MEVIGLIVIIGCIVSMCIFNDDDVKYNQKRFISKRKANPPMPRTLTNESKNNHK